MHSIHSLQIEHEEAGLWFRQSSIEEMENQNVQNALFSTETSIFLECTEHIIFIGIENHNI